MVPNCDCGTGATGIESPGAGGGAGAVRPLEPAKLSRSGDGVAVTLAPAPVVTTPWSGPICTAAPAEDGGSATATVASATTARLPMAAILRERLAQVADQVL